MRRNILNFHERYVKIQEKKQNKVSLHLNHNDSKRNCTEELSHYHTPIKRSIYYEIRTLTITNTVIITLILGRINL